MRRLRPLTPGEKAALLVAFFSLFAAIVHSMARNANIPGAWKAELGLTTIGLLLFAGVVYGLKAGFLGAPK